MRIPLLLLGGWLIGLPFAFIWSGYVSRYYPAWALPVIMLIASTLFAVCGMYLVNRAREVTVSIGTWTVALVFAFCMAIVALCLQYPNLFDVSLFRPAGSTAPLIWLSALLALPIIVVGLRTLEARGLAARMAATRLGHFVGENLPGMLAAFGFFVTYWILAHVFNRPGMDLTENFFAADNFAWIDRLAASAPVAEMRAVHPFAYFVLRPLVWCLALLFNGDRLAATIALIPLTGATCVLLAWLYVRKWTGRPDYALLFACLLGVSTSHLLFGSIVESYIFSAAVLLLFCVLLLSESVSLLALAAVGVVTFGITITNFIQTFIAFVVARPRLKAIFMYGMVVSVAALALTLLHAALYPSAMAFFLPSDAAVENEYAIAILGQPAWRLIGRALLLMRSILFYSVVAPKPFVQTAEVGGFFPRFNFFTISPGAFRYSGYEGIGQALPAAWVVLLLAAGTLFIWKLVRTRKVEPSLALALCLLFNFLLHMGYGFEPFLYSANWTYALILFASVSLSDIADRKWFKAALFIFLALLMVNQWQFLALIFENISPFLE